MFNPDYNDYQLTSIITECSGGVAVVYSALYKPNKQYVAVKRYFVDNSKENANLIQQDILTRKELHHQNILPYLTSFVHGRELYVVSPLMTFGSCRDILDQYFHEGLPELACAIILRDVLLALQYLHKQLYIHRFPTNSQVREQWTQNIKRAEGWKLLRVSFFSSVGIAAGWSSGVISLNLVLGVTLFFLYL